MSIESALRKARKAYKSAMEDGDSFGDRRPDGKYKAKLSEAKVAKSESSGRIQIVLVFIIKEGEEKGQKAPAYYGIMDNKGNINDVGVKIAVRQLRRLGAKMPEDIEALPDVCKSLTKAKPSARITLRTKPDSDFQDLFVDKLLDGDSSESSGTGSNSESESGESSESSDASEESSS